MQFTQAIIVLLAASTVVFAAHLRNAPAADEKVSPQEAVARAHNETTFANGEAVLDKADYELKKASVESAKAEVRVAEALGHKEAKTEAKDKVQEKKAEAEKLAKEAEESNAAYKAAQDAYKNAEDAAKDAAKAEKKAEETAKKDDGSMEKKEDSKQKENSKKQDDSKKDLAKAGSFIARHATTKRLSTLSIVILVSCLCCCVMPLISWCCCWALIFGVSAKALHEFENDGAKAMREKFDQECPDDEKKKYCSQEFRDECNELFEKSDKDNNRALELQELKEAVRKYLGNDAPEFWVSTLEKAFDDNKSKSIGKTEFFEMMKLVKYTKDTYQKAKEVKDSAAEDGPNTT